MQERGNMISRQGRAKKGRTGGWNAPSSTSAACLFVDSSNIVEHPKNPKLALSTTGSTLYHRTTVMALHRATAFI